MAEQDTSVASRQKDDDLFRHSEPLADGASVELPVRLVSGYGAIKFLGISDESFRIRVEEACVPGGPWTETHRIDSGVNPAGTDQIVCQAIFPCGSYMRVFIDNIAGANQTRFDLCGAGHPIAGASGDSGGGGGGGSNTLKDCATDTQASVKGNGIPYSGSPCDGGLQISGRDSTVGPNVQRHIAVDSMGRLIVVGSDVLPGTVIGPTPADTVVGIGATVPLPAIPVNTRRMTIQNTGPALSFIRLRELGGLAGAGELLGRFSSRMFGGADGAIAPLEVEDVSGVATTVNIMFERD